MSLPRPPGALALFFLFAAAPATAQVPLPPLTVPRGLMRFDIGGRFDNWDRRFLDGVRQEAAGDFNRDAVGGGWLPGLASAEEQLRAVTGVQAIALSLGKSSASTLVNVGTYSIGAAYGLTRRLTVFGTVPIVRVRVRVNFTLDSTTASAGFNPANRDFGTGAGATQTGAFLSQLQAALATLTTRLQSGFYDSVPAIKALAQATLTRGTALQGGLAPLLTTSAFLPLAGSPAATALTRSIDSLRTRLDSTLGIAGFTGAPALPTNRMGSVDFENYATSPLGPIAALPFTPPLISYLGDVEVGMGFLWLDHRGTARGGFSARSVLQGTVRLRTGRLARPEGLFEVPTGDRQPDVQGDLVTDLSAGRIGARLTARYVLQQPGRQFRRVTPPDQPLSPATTIAEVERDPGEITEGSIEPFLRIGPTFALVGGVRHWTKGVDKYTYPSSQMPVEGTSVDVLAIGSKENGTAFSAGLSFTHDGVRADGTVGLPMDASLRWEKVTSSTEGRVPIKETVVLAIRLYGRVF